MSDYQNYLSNLNSKFENQFTDIDSLLNKVISKSNKGAGVAPSPDRDSVDNNETNHFATSIHANPIKTVGMALKEFNTQLFDKSNIQELVKQSTLTKENELNSTNHTFSQTTPIKSRNEISSRSTAEAYQYGTPSQEDAYDYGEKVSLSSPEKVLKSLETPVRSQEAPRVQSESVLEDTPPKCMIPVKQRNPLFVEENLEQYQHDLKNLHKYAPEDVLRSVEKSSDGQFFVVNSLNQEQKSFRQSTMTGVELEQDPVDQIVILKSPNQEVGPDDKLLSIYQQISEVYNDDTSYIGEKYMGLRNGQGTYYFKDGYRYEGTWEEDKMSGFGIMWVDNDIKWYEGDWKDNTFHGKGIIYNLTPEEAETSKNYSSNLNEVGNAWVKYEGKFHKGAKHGFGTLFLMNGDTWTGAFNMDNVDGRGSYTIAGRKKTIAGLWKNNVLERAY